MAKLAVLVYNPSACSTDHPEKWLGPIIRRLCEQSNFLVITVPKHPKESYKDIIPLMKAPVELVIAAGGDGTVRYVLSALAAAGSKIPMAVIPLGTWNMLAQVIGIDHSVDKALSVIVAGKMMTLDTGVMNGHYFALAAGAGPVPEAFTKPNRNDKTHWKRIAYDLALLSTIFLPPVLFKITADDTIVQVAASGVFVSNVMDFGIGNRTRPEDLHDGTFYLSIVSPKTLSDYILLAARFLLGMEVGGHLVRMKRVKRAIIDVVADKRVPLSPFHRCCLQIRNWLHGKKLTLPPRYHEVTAMIDGSDKGTTPMHIDILPSSVKILVPEEFAYRDPGAADLHEMLDHIS